MDQEQENIIVLTDEDGNELEFEELDRVEVDGREYAILLPLDDEEDEAIILRVEYEENGEEVFSHIEDDEEWEKVADFWQEMSEEELDDQE
ncbi:DUF1292 domain-containing protein [Heliobacillus mobilis]|uniref:UPF0473 protein GJ688_12230 n=2 Tax=Heliobacterium TaxID=2697 RepID=A0A6I3SLE3_HELMO|nr:DUF1292 domain-containing protein [Heliobacterium mobile]MBC9785631.1 DUF1292 domain-containing protein [Heliobacterium chlorum]MTV49740.1 DUF1292 domain-containing protein [Heliobacterium mobile]